MHRTRLIAVLSFVLPVVIGCSGGSSPSVDGTQDAPDDVADAGGCTGSCTGPDSRLLADDVEMIIGQAVAEARARGEAATIAVVDRVGNVLGVYRMPGAPELATITSERGVVGGLEGLAVVPTELAAIAKAMTGAFLSSEGNAFTTRTANQIVQEHFNPGEFNQPSGPLFGVQFSQLPCSDLSRRFGGAIDAGPKRSPLGLSADPGGLPLYLAGAAVGGIGVESDGIYGLDLVITDRDLVGDEIIATAATFGYSAPVDRRAERITVEGKTFRFSDARNADVTAELGSVAALDAAEIIAVPAYFDGTIVDGTAFGQPASGIRPDALDYPGLDAFVLVDENNQERFRPRAGTDGASALSENEVRVLLAEALAIANRARAQIRRPLSTPARVTISVVDTNGVILGIARTRDAPIFGIDVSLQKARTAAFFSGDFAADDLIGAPNAIYRNADASPSGVEIEIGSYVAAVRELLQNPAALSDGAIAFADRSGGNLSRPFFPDGILGTEHGPFSKPFEAWSPFSVGLQLDLVLNALAQHLFFFFGLVEEDVAQNCTTIDRLANGIQIFPGSVPIYRDSTLIGGIGVSGDGVDQDDMISFLGLHNAGEALGTINNAPPEMRADRLTPNGTRLRYVQCPQAPFIDSDEQNVCAGK